MNDQSKKDIKHTATIFGAGALGTLGANVLGKKLGWSTSVKKMTALGTGTALATDYAAVKLNKHLDKEAMNNIYLEKIAENYQIPGHSGWGNKNLATGQVTLERPQYHEYANHIENKGFSTQLKYMSGGALAGGALGALWGLPFTGKALQIGALGAIAGLGVGAHTGRIAARDNALESINVAHPYILDLLKEDYK
jgi:uncharacterized membrane protein YebE (DUF533 family)